MILLYHLLHLEYYSAMASYKQDNALAERIFSDLNSTLDRLHFVEFTILATTDDYRCNKSPVIVEENKLALESWCLRLLFLYSSSHLLGQKKLWLEESQFNLLSNHSRLLVLLNPDHTTAWNIRRILVSEEYLDPWNELKLNALAMTRKPKSDDVFTYRQWLIEYLRKFKFQQLNDSIIEEEFSFCSKAYEQHSRNYYAWTYAIWLTTNFCRHRFDVLQRQLDHSKIWIERHVSDYSCFHYRQLLLDCFCSISNNAIISDIPVPHKDRLYASNSSVDLILKDNHLVLYSQIPMLVGELDWLDGLISTYKIRESFLLHRRFILSSIKNLTQEKTELLSAWTSVICRERKFLTNLKDNLTIGHVDDVSKVITHRYIEAFERMEPKVFDCA